MRKWTEKMMREHLTMLDKSFGSAPTMDSWKYRTVPNFLLREASFFRAMPLPINVPRGTIKECYSNALTLIIEQANPKLAYCEGVAAGIIPVQHAWCVDEDGRVLDPTWDQCDGHPGLGNTYFGVRIATDYVADLLLMGKGCALDNWHDGWPVLRGDENWRINEIIIENHRSKTQRRRDRRIKSQRQCKAAGGP